MWKRKNRSFISKYTGASFQKVLREQKRSNENFEIMLNNLTLEELIALKLEIAYKKAGRLHGLPLWSNRLHIISEAFLLFAISAANSKDVAAALLGIRGSYFDSADKLYQVKNYFEKDSSEFDWVKKVKKWSKL